MHDYYFYRWYIRVAEPLKTKKVGNIRQVSKRHWMIAQCPTPPTKMKAPPTLQKNPRKSPPPPVRHPTPKPEPAPNTQRTTVGSKSQLKLRFQTNIFKSEHNHWILHNQISLGTKFQLKLTILILQTKFTQWGYFRRKAEKSHICLCLWSLLTILNVSAQGPTDTTASSFSLSSRRDNY